MTHFLPDEAATIAFARRLQAAIGERIAGWTILLDGELGTGKSTLARAFIRAMGHGGPVPSPTYTLVEPYRFPAGIVYHVDLYRISDEEELRYLGWNELDEGLRLVEWPKRAPGLAAGADLSLSLDYADTGRNLDVAGLSERGEQLARTLST
jgi:tRNA threonylcarbamoyladenosine biosynthesis protein TsaE